MDYYVIVHYRDPKVAPNAVAGFVSLSDARRFANQVAKESAEVYSHVTVNDSRLIADDKQWEVYRYEGE